MAVFVIKESLCNKKLGVLDYVALGDTILLIQDGVLVLNTTHSELFDSLKSKGVAVLALKEDLELRGIKNNLDIRLIDYGEFIDIIEQEKVVS